MIQFNLLPDVKLEYIRAERTRRLILGLSFIVTAGAIGLLVLLLSFGALQKNHLKGLDKDITTKSAQLKGKPQINRILTVQNQLGSLTPLHSTKPAASRLFGYLNQVTPTNTSITNFQIDFTAKTATVSGTTDSLSSVNKYIDTLKFTTFKVAGADTEAKAFNSIVLTSFGISSGSASKPAEGATYTATLAYDGVIFDTTKKVTLAVPNVTTTRSAVDKPADLFQAAPALPAKAGN